MANERARCNHREFPVLRKRFRTHNRAQILDDLAIKVLGPQVALRLRVAEPRTPELVDVFPALPR